jgi:O-antigen/teichoic acid export membrane protein
MSFDTDMRGRVARGLGWVGAAQVVLQITRTIGAIFIARLLAPEEYGLAMLALVFASLVLVFSDLAFGAALVQRKRITDADRNTAFWITIGSGALFTVLGVALAHPVAALYGEPEVAPLLAVLAASFLIGALGSTQQSLLLREMAFKKTETLGVVAAFAGTVAAVGCAAAGAGAWAIIAQQLVTSAISTVLLWRASSWRPRFQYSKASAQDLWSFSSFLVGHRLLYYLHQNADRFIIGRFLGTAALGAYAVAYNVMLQPVAKITGPVQRVLAPAFSRMQDEPERIAAAWARATRLVGMLAIPSLAGVVVVAPDFVPVVLGEKWNPAIPVIQIIAFVGMIQAVQGVNVDILMARDRTSTLFRYTAVFCAAHIAAFLIGVNWGITGVAVAYLVSSLLVEPILTVITARALGVSVLVFLRSLSGIVQATVVMVLIVALERLWLLDAEVPAVLRLVLCALTGAVVFFALCAWRVPEVARDVRQLMSSRRSGGRVTAETPA